MLFVLLFASGYVFGQIPSINEQNITKSNIIIKNQSDSSIFSKILDVDTEIGKLENKKSDTFSLIESNELKKLKLDKDSLISILINEIKTEKKFSNKVRDSLIFDFNTKIEAITKKLEINSDLNKLIELEQDSIKLVKKRNEFIKNFESNKKNNFKPKNWFPSTKDFYKSYFYKSHYGKEIGRASLLNSLTLFKNDSINTFNTELVSDAIGWFRVSFGTTVSLSQKVDPDESTQNLKDLEKLLSGGGNFYLDFILPVATTYTNRQFTFYGFFNLKLATDIKGFDNNLTASTTNGSFGLSTYTSLSSDNKTFNFSINTNSNLHYGTSVFFDNLNVPEKVFFNTNVIGTFTIDNKYRFAIKTNFASEPNLRTEKIAFGLQLLN